MAMFNSYVSLPEGRISRYIYHKPWLTMVNLLLQRLFSNWVTHREGLVVQFCRYFTLTHSHADYRLQEYLALSSKRKQ